MCVVGAGAGAGCSGCIGVSSFVSFVHSMSIDFGSIPDVMDTSSSGAYVSHSATSDRSGFCLDFIRIVDLIGRKKLGAKVTVNYTKGIYPMEPL